MLNIEWTVLHLLAWGLGLHAIQNLRHEFDHKAKPWFFLIWGVFACLIMEIAMLGAEEFPGLFLVSSLLGLISAFFVAAWFRFLFKELCDEDPSLLERNDWDRIVGAAFLLGAATALLVGWTFPNETRAAAAILHVGSGAVWLVVAGSISGTLLLTKPCAPHQEELYTPYWLSLAFALAFFNTASEIISRLLGTDLPPELSAIAGSLFIIILVMTLYTTVIRVRSHKLAQALRQIHDFQDKLAGIEKVAAVGTLAAGTAHDFNNSLAAIIGMAEVATTDGEISDKTRKHLENIQKSAWAASKVAGSLLQLARRQTGIIPFENIKEAIQSPLTALAKDFKRHEIQVIENIEDVPKIDADLGLISQVCLNLYLNARDAMKAKRGGRLEVTLKHADDEILIEVSDTGSGIPASFKDKIFQAFQTTKGEKGTGLGLSVSYSVVKSMGGTLSFESVEGLGTVFRVRVPLKKDASLAAPKVPEALHVHPGEDPAPQTA